jgi:septation ring formation regulator EzrA
MVYFIIIIVLLSLMSMSYCIGYRHAEEDQIEEQERAKNDIRSYADKYID